jgi:hypothetical protein
MRLGHKAPWDPKQKRFETQIPLYVLVWFVIAIAT